MKSKSLLLDLDETLVHTFLCGTKMNELLKELNNMGVYGDESLMSVQKRIYKVALLDPDTPSGTGEQYGCVGIFRPHCLEFLVNCFRNFRKVGIWSAGKKKYVRKIAAILESLTQFKFDVIYTYDDCEVNDNGIIYKPIRKLLNQHPNFGNISSVIIVDDRKSTMIENKKNGILIRRYSPDFDVGHFLKDDVELMKLLNFFHSDKCKQSEDVREMEKFY